jgi:hypothetical protein
MRLPPEGLDMQRWTPRAIAALLLCIGLPAVVAAQTPTPAAPPIATPPAAPATGMSIVVPNGVIYMDPYHAATPYNPTVVNQAVPNPALDRPFTTLPCNNANQNFDPYAPAKKACGRGLFQKKSGCGCGSACDPTPSEHPVMHELTHPVCGYCGKGGTCTTCCNSSNFILGSSRSFFGESAREFFERPPAPDGIKAVPKAYYPPPAPAAYTPASLVVEKP